MSEWQISYEPDETLQADLNTGLDSANANALGHEPDRTPVFINVARYDADGLVAGLSGKALLASGWFYIQLLYVRADQRGKGLGLELIDECARQAKAKGFSGLTVQTMAFQAVPFYRKAGFEQYATLENDFAGQTRYYFKKRIA